MSHDLISRKAVIDYLREQNNNVIIEKQKDGFVSEDICRGMESAISAFRNFILTLPTDFDKKKVLEELNDTKDIPHDDSAAEITSTRIWNKAITKSIKIVEKGGIE